MRSLIFGAGGQIGAHLLSAADRMGESVQGTWYRRPLPGFVPVDLLDRETVTDTIGEFEPDVIFLAAGMSQIDYAETHEAECLAIAVQGTTNIAEAAKGIGATLVLFTSDQVFGECPHPVQEDVAVGSLSVYGRAQSNAESTLRRILPETHLIVRTSTVYGAHELPRNSVLHVIRRLKDGHTLTAARDRYVQPTYAPDLAEACLKLVLRGETGTIHITGSERITEFALARQIAFLHGFDCDLIEGVPAAALCEEAPRPNNPWLDRARLRMTLGTQAIRPIREGLRAMTRESAVEMPVYRAA